MHGDFLLAIPVFNEERYLRAVLAQARQYSEHILVIDDGSTDATAEILRGEASIHTVTHQINRGYGRSIADAFAFARCRGYSWLITMDCDEQHEASHIPRFVEAMAEDAPDVISGTRYPRGRKVDVSVPPDRRRINQQITQILNCRLGLGITDAFCGFKAYRVSALERISLTVPGYAVPMQFWVQAWRGGLVIEELPVRLIYHDPTRHFGGLLDDPDARLRHYLEVFEAELTAGLGGAVVAEADQAPCR